MIAETTPLLPSYITELSANAAIIAAFFFLFKWFLKTQTAELRSISYAINASSLVITDLHMTLIAHDARVRGIDPESKDDRDPGHKDAVESYKQILSHLEKTNFSINRLVEESKKIA